MIGGKKENAANNTFGDALAALDESTNGGKGENQGVDITVHSFLTQSVVRMVAKTRIQRRSTTNLRSDSASPRFLS